MTADTKEKPALMVKCVNATDRCQGSEPCPWCEPVMPLRHEDGTFASHLEFIK